MDAAERGGQIGPVLDDRGALWCGHLLTAANARNIGIYDSVYLL